MLRGCNELGNGHTAGPLLFAVAFFQETGLEFLSLFSDKVSLLDDLIFSLDVTICLC